MKKKLIILGCFFLLLFFFISFLVFMGKLNHFDNFFTLFLQNHISRNYDPFLSLLSLLGSVEITTSTFLLVVILNFKIIRSIFPVVFYLISALVELIGKSAIYHPGPPANFFRYDLGFFFPSSYIETNFSYPSGHALRTTFIISFIIYLLLKNNRLNKPAKKLLIAGLTIFLLLMLFSRISLGEHWASDVMAGSFLGAGFSLLAIRSLQINK